MSTGLPDFTAWGTDDLRAHRMHLEKILIVSAGQNDPVRAELRAELDAARGELKRRATDPPSAPRAGKE